MSALEESLKKVFKLQRVDPMRGRVREISPEFKERAMPILKPDPNAIPAIPMPILKPGPNAIPSVPMPMLKPDPNRKPSMTMPMLKLDPNAIPSSPMPMLKINPVSKPDDDKRFVMEALQGSKGAMPNSLAEIFMGTAVGPTLREQAKRIMESRIDPLREQAQTIPERGATAQGIESLIESPDEEEQEAIDRLLLQEAALDAAPLGGLAKALREQGQKEDTELAHLRLGEVVLPPEFLEDDEFSDVVEKKFNESGINPEEAVVGGIGALNPTTGLQQFFLKKVFKGVKKVVKKVAPYAGLIAAPFTGGASAALIGGLGGAISGGGIKGALKGAALGSLGSAVAGGLGGAGTGKGIGGFFGRAREFILPGTDKVGLFGNIRKGIGSLGSLGTRSAGRALTMPVRDPITGQFLNMPTTGGGFLANLISGGGGAGGGGGFGGLARNLGIGGLALGLGKLAFKDAERQQGVPLTPLTTMSPTGRYNIEAEIARRMGQPAPNPVEFGLLPANTFPELSGAKPVMASLGGAIEELEGGTAQGMQEGGSVDKMRGFAMRAEQANATIEELEETFNPNNIRDLIASNLPFDPTIIEDLLTSSEKKQYDRAKLDFSTAILRQETGSVMSQSEVDYIDKLYFPQVGDDENVTILKRRARQKAIDNLMPTQKPQSKGIGSLPMMGGPVMAYAQGGAVAMQKGGEMDPSNFPPMDGDINGPGTEQSDDIPAMLSDGEFVMTARAVRGAGSYEMQTEPGGIINLIPSLEEDRERGMDVMYKVMDTFSEQAKPS